MLLAITSPMPVLDISSVSAKDRRNNVLAFSMQFRPRGL